LSLEFDKIKCLTIEPAKNDHETDKFRPTRVRRQEKITRRERFLAEMEQSVSWSRLLEALSTHYYSDSRSKRGRTPIPLKRILRMYFVQQ
jgi:IS5 family transposase